MFLKISCIIGLLIGLYMESACTTATPTTTTFNARLFINRVNRQMFNLYDDVNRLIYDKENNEYHQDFDLIDKRIDEISSLTKEAQQFNLNEINDPEVRKAIENISKSAYLYILGADNYDEFSTVVETMMMPALKKGICEYNNLNSCHLSYIPDIKNMLAGHTYDSDKLLYYWSEWRSEIELNSKPKFPLFINLYKLAANKTGVTPVEFLYNYYDSDITIIDNMKQVMNELMPLYKEMHAYIRYELNKMYGDNIVPLDKLIPDHIFQVVLLQAWKKSSIVEQPYPEHKLPNLKGGLNKQHLNAQGMIDLVENFYVSLGFDSLPRKIRSNFLRKTDRELGSECKAEIFDQTPNIRMDYCQQVNIRKLLQMYGYMGRVHYAYEKRDLPFHFYNSYKFEDAVSEALILSASSPDHLMNIDIVPKGTYTPELEMNRLFRMGVHTLLEIPLFYVHVKLIEDILSGTTNLANINVHYWNLMEEYAGVEPPIDRNTESLDLPYKFFYDLKSNRLVTKFISEILGYQIYESLCKTTGLYVPNSNENKLSNCNLDGQHKVSEKLKDMMELGSKKSWRETLSTVTGNTNGLSAQSLLNYYAPLRTWLQQELQQKNIRTGWKPTTKILNMRVPKPR